jgi:hypothetical protein
VQEQDRRRSSRSALPIKDLETVNVNAFVTRQLTSATPETDFDSGHARANVVRHNLAN